MTSLLLLNIVRKSLISFPRYKVTMLYEYPPYVYTYHSVKKGFLHFLHSVKSAK